jgi:hypothetical protein
MGFVPVSIADRACNAAEAAYPQLWDRLWFAVAPGLGIQHQKMVENARAARVWIEQVNGAQGSELVWVPGGSPWGACLQYMNYGYGLGITCSNQYQKGDLTIVISFATASVDGGAIQTLIANGTGVSASDYALQLNSTAGRVNVLWGAGQQLTSSTNLEANRWYTLAMRRRGGSGSWVVDLWLDGVPDGSNNVTYDPNGNSDYTVIGGWVATQTNLFWGLMGPVSMWSRGLSPTEIRLLARDPMAAWRAAEESAFSGLATAAAGRAAWAGLVNQRAR